MPTEVYFLYLVRTRDKTYYVAVSMSKEEADQNKAFVSVTKYAIRKNLQVEDIVLVSKNFELIVEHNVEEITIEVQAFMSIIERDGEFIEIPEIETDPNAEDKGAEAIAQAELDEKYAVMYECFYCDRPFKRAEALANGVPKDYATMYCSKEHYQVDVSGMEEDQAD